jgi:DNA repair protein RadC
LGASNKQESFNDQTIRVSDGGISHTVVDPKRVFKAALEHNTSSLVLCHNHPSGNLNPSQADIKLTQKLIQASQTLDIQILDHIIVSNTGYFSFADEGKLK